MITLREAQVAERDAFDALAQKINEGVTLTEPKVPVLKLVGTYRAAVRLRMAVEIRDSVIEQIPPWE